MASDLPDLSKTDRNLWNAIVGEAMAYLKYNAFAHKALEEGLPEVAQIFQEVAGAETIITRKAGSSAGITSRPCRSADGSVCAYLPK